MNNKRDRSLDLFRCLMMFGICLLHSIEQCGHWTSTNNWPHWILAFGCAMRTCVDGFAFLSGYFGVRFSFSKIFRLYGLATICAGITLAVNASFGIVQIDNQWKVLWEIVKGNWYLNAYVALMLVAPLVNLALENIKTPRQALQTLVPFFVLASIWGTFAEGWGEFFRNNLPMTSGLGSKTWLTLLAVYILGYETKRFEVYEKLPRGWFLIAFPVLLLACAFFGFSNSFICTMLFPVVAVLCQAYTLAGDHFFI